MKREEAIQELQNCKGLIQQDGQDYLDERDIPLLDMAIESLSAEHEWIPVSEKLPSELEAVNVTWVNHNPPMYYQDIKDVPKVDTAVYYRGAWYWWDATVIDLLGEYGGAYIHDIEPIDKDIEVTAWLPLPTPYGERREQCD